MQLPVGEIFEAIIHWLKANLGGIFDAISATIDFSISVLEKVLSVDPHHWYPMVIITILIAALIYCLSREKLGWRIALGASILTLLFGISLETWRHQQFHSAVTDQDLSQLKTSIDSIQGSLEGKELQFEPETIPFNQGVIALRRLSSQLDRTDSGTLRSKVFNLRNFERSQLFLEELSSSDLATAKDSRDLAKRLKSYNPHPLAWYPWLITSILMILLAWFGSGRGLAIFALIGCWLIQSMGYWQPTIETLALVISATLFALLIGVPVGIGAARSQLVDKISKPILDFMQTMPAFVYLIPAVLFFGLGEVPGAIATLIFAMPPAVRLTSLGIRGVPAEVVEAAQSFGSTPMQLLFKAQLPIALPTILAGLNQTIMLALSMVVIGGMIGAGGLGEVVLSGITQLKIGLGFESGLSVVILAIYLDRLTQAIGGAANGR